MSALVPAANIRLLFGPPNTWLWPTPTSIRELLVPP